MSETLPAGIPGSPRPQAARPDRSPAGAPPPLRRICVFCGSSPGATPLYRQQTEELAAALVAAGLGLVYGGAHVGLMGTLADSVLARGGEVIGVIPEALVAREIAHPGLTDLRVVGSMHERKALMADLADGFIALPGGLGTLEEFFEVLTWAQLGLHAKPCGLLDTDGFFASLLAFLDHAVAQRFLRPEHRQMVLVDSDAGRLLERFAAYQPAVIGKWIDRAET